MSVVRHQFKERKYRCQNCDNRATGFFWEYDPAPNCAAEHGAMVEIYPERGGTLMIIGDEFPGGMEVPHVLCSEDGTTPGIVYSKSELRSRLAAKGWTIADETPKVLQRHVDERGAAAEAAVRRAMRG